MKKIVFLFFVIIFSNVYAQQGWNLTLLSHFNDPNLAKIGTQIWNANKGWADTIKHREYIVAGSVDSIYFFDITNPSVMKKCAVKNGINHSINRDFDIYDHYVYCVSDNGTPGALQIFDMQYLPDSVHSVYESDVTGMNCHTVFVNPLSKRLYKCINRYKTTNIVIPLEVYSIANPANPVFLGRIERSGYADVHESYVRNDTVYCSSGWQGLFIYDFTDALHPKVLGSITPPYPESAYNHSCWLDSSGKYMVFTDETAEGTGIKIYDITDLQNPKAVGNPFRSYGSPHNTYWLGKFIYASMYYGGVNIYLMDTLTKPKLIASYPTFDKPHTNSVYEGCWGVYPYLPSGNIIASDMNTGIFLLKPSSNLAISETQIISGVETFPNPFTNKVSIRFLSTQKQQAHLLVYNLQGKIVTEKIIETLQGENEIEINNLEQEGMYIIKIVTSQQSFHQSVFKL